MSTNTPDKNWFKIIISILAVIPAEITNKIAGKITAFLVYSFVPANIIPAYMNKISIKDFEASLIFPFWFILVALIYFSKIPLVYRLIVYFSCCVMAVLLVLGFPLVLHLFITESNPDFEKLNSLSVFINLLTAPIIASFWLKYKSTKIQPPENANQYEKSKFPLFFLWSVCLGVVIGIVGYLLLGFIGCIFGVIIGCAVAFYINSKKPSPS